MATRQPFLTPFWSHLDLQVSMTSSTPQNSTPQSTGDVRPEPPANAQAYQFEQLSAGAQEVLIEHRGQQYRLRVTRNGGLILNK